MTIKSKLNTVIKGKGKGLLREVITCSVDSVSCPLHALVAEPGGFEKAKLPFAMPV